MKRSEWLLNVGLVVMIACAALTTGLLVRREVLAHRAAEPQSVMIRDWQQYARSGHWLGPRDARVRLVVFADFQCPYCAILAPHLAELRRAHPRDVAVIFRHFPLAGHPQARAAVRASECAAAQGRFEEFHDTAFHMSDSVATGAWDYLARTSGVGDARLFHSCIEQTGTIPQLAADTLAAHALGVEGTPTLLINNRRIEGALPLDTLESYTAQALREHT